MLPSPIRETTPIPLSTGGHPGFAGPVAETNRKAARSLRRHGGLDLLRIVAMLGVLVLHAVQYPIGLPAADLLRTRASDGVLFLFVHATAVCSVNVFVLISGWFGIRPKMKRVAGLFFQNVFFVLLLDLAGVFLLGQRPASEMARNLFLLTDWNWFIKSYFLLYLLAPVLNAYAETARRPSFRSLLAAFFVFQAVFGWLSVSCNFFWGGFSPVSFVGLYLLARYVRRFEPVFSQHSKSVDLAVYLGCSTVLFCAMAGCILAGKPFWVGRYLTPYNNPLVILSALSLLLFFSKLDIRSRFVAVLAPSAYAIYLLHAHPSILHPVFVPSVLWALHGNDGLAAELLFSMVLAAFAVAAIGLDLIRLTLWRGTVRFVEAALNRRNRVW